jgi:hypothetical protein
MGVLAAGISVMSVSGAFAATWYPELKLEARYDDNVLHLPNGSDDVLEVVIPGVRVLNRDPITSYDLMGRSAFTNYTRTDAKTSRTDLARLDLLHRPGYFERLDVKALYERSIDPIDFSQGVVTTRGDVSTASGRMNLELFRVGAAVALSRWDYARGDLADGRSADATARLFPVNTRITRLTLAARRRELDLNDHQLLRADYQTVALRRVHSEGFWTELEAGRVEVQFHDGSSPDVRPAVAFTLNRTGGSAGEPLTLHAKVANDFATTVDAGITRTGGGRLADLSYETNVDADGGLYRVPTITRRGALDVRDTLGGGQIVELNGSYGRTRSLRQAGPSVDQWRAGAGISTPIGGFLSARVGWDFLRQKAPQGGVATEFDRNRYSVSVTTARVR